MDFLLLDYITLNEKLANKLTGLSQKDEAGILALSEKVFKGNTCCLNRKSNLIKLAAVLKASEKTYNLYKEKGISDEIYAATFSDITIWCENCGNTGLENVNWIKNHICFELFRLGRLQFQLFTAKSSLLNYSKLPFSKNEKLIYVHIPQGEGLDYNECVNSFRLADSFFKTYFPEYSYNYYFCESWLLFKNNTLFMRKDSNIIKFMSHFDIHYSVFEEAQAFERIFGEKMSLKSILSARNKIIRKSNIVRFPESTSLQKSAKKYLLNGNKLGVGIATMPKNKYSVL